VKLARRTKRWLAGILAMQCCVWLGFVVYVNWAMHQPPEVFGHVMASMPTPAYFLFPFETLWVHARKGSLEVGDMAPGLEVKALGTEAPVQLGSLWADKPVVLVFGSYT
jgi:hypothetical protein